MTPGIYYAFINTAILFSSVMLITCHIAMLAVVWNWIVPAYGKGLKGPSMSINYNNYSFLYI